MKATLIVIQNDADHAEAKALVARLMASDAKADRARGLAQARLIEAYEKTRWPRKRPALRDLLAYLMDQHGLTRADLIPILGTASRVSEVLGGKRELSMTMIKRLRDRFHVPADLLIPRTSRKRTAA
jgi:HTH-type transcriptional regulator/antitoxin HigA